MKQYIYILSILFLGAAVACNEKENVVGPEKIDGTETVTFKMKVTVPEKQVRTKGDCAVKPIIDNIYVATFGSRGYLNEYVKAVPVGAYATENGTQYEMTVSLLATTSKRYVHVIANGPESLDYNTKDTDILLDLTTTYDADGVPQGAYWQYFYLEKGTAVWDDITESWTASTEATNALQSITLIRNFAKVTVTSTAKYTVGESEVDALDIQGFYVFRTEGEGSIAMPTSTAGLGNFLSAANYSAATSAAAISDIWSGYTPGSVSLVDETATTYDANKYISPGSYQFVYESVKSYTNNKQPFIILYARHYNQEKKQYEDYKYYRIELTDNDGEYYPILRNLSYDIKITSVAEDIQGYSDPTQAVMCNGNVSTAIDANISDVSDGYSALYVLYTDKTFANSSTENKAVTFMYQYIPDIVNAPTTYAQASLAITGSDGSGHAIADATGTSWYEQTGPEDGWYTVTYYVLPSSSIESEAVSTFRVTGSTTISGETKTLFRNITARLIPFQDFSNLSVTGSGTTAGSTVTISFDLPDGLPSSMFPLEISVQDSELALNPVVGTENMTLVTHDDGETFHFVKTVSYASYSASKTVTCQMYLIQNIVDTTNGLKITVANEFFNDPETLVYKGN